MQETSANAISYTILSSQYIIQKIFVICELPLPQREEKIDFMKKYRRHRPAMYRRILSLAGSAGRITPRRPRKIRKGVHSEMSE